MTITTRSNGEQVVLATVLNSKLEAPVLQSEMGLDVQATATKQAVRWDEFSLKHNNDGTFKGITNNDIQANAAIVASKLATQKQYKKATVSNPSTTANTYGTSVDFTPPTNFLAINPRHMDIVVGGTVGAETLTFQLIMTYSDGTTSTMTKTATAVGTTSLSGTDWFTLFKDNVYINKINVSSQSSIASTLATVTFNHIGFYL
jgi:hypothetical protein